MIRTVEPASSINSRGVAAGIVSVWLESAAFPDRLVAAVRADHAFVMEVVYGVARWKRMLAWAAERCSRGRPDPQALPYLLVGLYQILVLDDVAPHAAVNETVEAVKQAGQGRLAPFVNGLLRRAVRERDDIRRELAAQKLGVRESHPDVLIRRWNARFGPERTAELCRFDNTRPDVVIRPNRLQITLEDLRGRLESAGIRATPHPAAPEQCLKLGHGTRVENLPGYAEGMFTVQDPSTLRSVDRLDPQPGESILDACAAPGGKTLLIAERLRGQGQIVAMDLHRDRLLPLADNLRRLRIDNARIVLGDASDPAAVGRAGGAPFDRILLDVPCSNTGVLRRRPDARWRFSPGRLGKLVRMQRSLLDSVSGFLKPGGCLVYSTCSLEHEENEGMVRAWVEEHPHFALGGCEVTFPPETRTDGVYAASLRRGPAR